MKPPIAYLKQETINRAKWDDCIRQSVNGLVYGASWYLDAVCHSWDALVLGDYKAVFPLPFNSKYGLFYSLQPLFCQQLGLFAKSEKDLAHLPVFLAAVPKKFLLTKLNLNAANAGIAHTTPRRNYVLDLNRDYETIRKNFGTTCRKHVRKSKDAGTSLQTGISTAQVMEMVKANLHDRNVLSSGQFAQMHRLMEAARQNNSLETIGVFDENNNLCAAAGIIKDYRRLYNVCGGANTKGRETYANVRIIDFIVATYAGQNMVFDFEGSELPAVAGYFRNFGPAETHYYLYERNLLPWPLNKIIT
ncbi:MAG: hypothetical protein EOO03_13060 [Chitinophagaceae bacterium]|nr:MAG: hypothetical protein EOO03_13060 [Chitinophagaceae bacterium]